MFWNFIPENEDVAFKYSDLFKEKLAIKKADHSYRVFKKVARMADQFPMAHEYSGKKKEVTVWCSNDYLGKLIMQQFTSFAISYYLLLLLKGSVLMNPCLGSFSYL